MIIKTTISYKSFYQKSLTKNLENFIVIEDTTTLYNINKKLSSNIVCILDTSELLNIPGEANLANIIKAITATATPLETLSDIKILSFKVISFLKDKDTETNLNPK